MRARSSAILLACIGLALAPVGVGSSAKLLPSFAPARSYVAGESLAYAAIGDLNGDGKPDLAAVNDDDDTVSVLINRGEGRFRARRAYRTHFSPQSVAIGDLNGDGKPDLATANAGDVSVLLNKGDGTFGMRRDYATDEGSQSLAIGDLNGDGKADLAVENGDNPGSVSVLLNKGDGSFQPKVDYPIGDFGLGSVAIGDLNRDGKPDLAAVLAPRNNVSVFFNKGDGTFQPKADYTTGNTPLSVAISDLNGDGKPDLATANSVKVGSPGTVSVLLNTGEGSFETRRDYATGREPQSIAVGDLNGDRKPDLTTANWYDSVSVLVNRGDGSFQSPRTFPSGPNPESVAIGDLNKDDKRDLVIADSGQDPQIVSVLLNATGLCAVPQITRAALPVARRAIASAGCRVGRISRAYSRTVKRGRVVSQKPKPGTVLRKGGKVNLIISKGRRR
jgi:hypothetical protein